MIRLQTDGIVPSSTFRFPSIVSTPDVCGGAARLVRTRIPVWTLESFRRLGASDEVLLDAYPTLVPADLEQARAYAEEHADEIDTLIRENDEEE